MKKYLVIVLCFLICLNFTISVGALDIIFGTTADHGYASTTKSEAWYLDAYKFVTNELLMTEICYKTENLDDYFLVYYFDFFGDRCISRAEVAAIISRYDWHYDTIDSGKYDSSNCSTFVDVPDGQYYTPAAQWAYDNGIIKGVGGAYFAPDRTITREEFAVMLYRFTEYLGEDTSERVSYGTFTDKDEVSSWANDAMSWAVAKGLISGKPDNKLAPKDTITRAEVALIIYRYNNNVIAHRDIRP